MNGRIIVIYAYTNCCVDFFIPIGVRFNLFWLIRNDCEMRNDGKYETMANVHNLIINSLLNCLDREEQQKKVLRMGIQKSMRTMAE